MADTHETIADIIAGMRGMGNYQRYSGDHARVLAGRLEAAHRRERGDCAKLREALKRIVAASIVAKNANAPEWILQRMADVFAMATTALAAPPRNCDRFATAEEARQAWLDDAGNWDEFGSPKLELHEWLYAPATEKEGGTNGNE